MTPFYFSTRFSFTKWNIAAHVHCCVCKIYAWNCSVGWANDKVEEKDTKNRLKWNNNSSLAVTFTAFSDYNYFTGLIASERLCDSEPEREWEMSVFACVCQWVSLLRMQIYKCNELVCATTTSERRDSKFIIYPTQLHIYYLHFVSIYNSSSHLIQQNPGDKYVHSASLFVFVYFFGITNQSRFSASGMQWIRSLNVMFCVMIFVCVSLFLSLFLFDSSLSGSLFALLYYTVAQRSDTQKNAKKKKGPAICLHLGKRICLLRSAMHTAQHLFTVHILEIDCQTNICFYFVSYLSKVLYVSAVVRLVRFRIDWRLVSARWHWRIFPFSIRSWTIDVGRTAAKRRQR